MSRGRALLLALALLLSAHLVALPASAQAAEPRVLPQLQQEAGANPRATFRVIIQRNSRSAAADAAIVSAGGKKLRDLSIDAFVATLPGRAIAAVGQSSAVRFVTYDALMRKTGSVSASSIGTFYPGTVRSSELIGSTTGAGVGVAIIDTGVSSRADFSSAAGRSRIVASAKFSWLSYNPNDTHGHGTHVAGIVAGNSWLASANQGKYVGVAPEANIISVKVADDTGMSFMSDVIDAIEWTIANRVAYNIRVINLSLVSSVAESARTSMLSAAVQRAWFSGILVVVAAGNDGPNSMLYPPANDPFAITVGAADPMGTAARGDDGMAPWSSYGVTQDGVAKPDVVAPGRAIISTLAGGSSTLARLFPSRVVDGSYIWMSGTSMAAPVVAGIAALAFEQNPGWTNDQVKWLLMSTATRVSADAAAQGAGQVDAALVVRYSGAPQYANQGLAPNENLVIAGGSATYTSASWSSASWSSASWSSASWSSASWSSASWSSANWSTASLTSASEGPVE